MKLMMRNFMFRFLSLANIFNKMGAAIYNIVFIAFAATMPDKELAIGIANVTVLVPVFFTVLVGIKADQTKKKVPWLIALGYVQAVLFVMVSYLTHSTTWMAFSVICLINIISDVISDYRGGLEMPIIQHNVDQDQLMEAYSFNQFIFYACNLAGQGLGVWLLSQSQQNYGLVALINALFFVLSSVILVFTKKRLTYQASQEEVGQEGGFKLTDMYQNLKLVFMESESSNFTVMVLSVLMINGLGSALGAIYNLYFLDHPILNLSFSQSLFVFQVIAVVFSIIGSLTPNDYFGKQSLSFMIFVDTILLALIGVFNVLQVHHFFALSALAFIFYLAGKVNPKISALLMSSLPSDVLAQTSNLLSLLFMLSMPLGSFLFTTLAFWNIRIAWLIFALLASLTLSFILLKNNPFQKESKA